MLEFFVVTVFWHFFHLTFYLFVRYPGLLVQLLQGADWVGISLISQIEFLVFSGLSQADRDLFLQFLQRVEVIGLAASDNTLIESVIEIRQQYRLKIPDAMIAAIALQKSASLVTKDQGFTRGRNLTIISW
jgi:tRNA(fMet)-specific endonuclease VapC